MDAASKASNEKVLDYVESLGGSYVWEREIFSVTLVDVPIRDSDAEELAALVGVEQIAVNVSNLSFLAIKHLASIKNLKSLVISGSKLSEAQLSELRSICPEVVLVQSGT